MALAGEHLVGLALAINRRECRMSATALGRFLDGRFYLLPVEIGDGVSFDFDARRKGCVLHLNGRLNRATLAHMGGLGKKLRRAG